MTTQVKNRKIPDGAYATAQELLESGETPAGVEQKLLALGVPVDVAKEIIADHQRATSQVASEEGRTEMQWAPIAIGLGVLLLITSGPGSLSGWFGIVVGVSRFVYGWYRKR